jgi:hypothetical protein
MATTNNLQVTLLEQNQAQKEFTINNALVVIDTLLNSGVIDVDITAVPINPANADSYILASSGLSGFFAGKEKTIAFFYNASWQFISPKNGASIWVKNKSKFYVYHLNAWQQVSLLDNNFSQLGINTLSDVNNKLAVKSDDVLLASNTGNIRLKVNKNATSNNASLVFQNNYSTRAEMGVLNNDNFEIKVSNDGSLFKQALTIDKATAQVDVKENSYFAKPIKLQSYTITTLPAANISIGSIAYVSNGAGGLPIVAFSDGTSWLRLDTRAVVS